MPTLAQIKTQCDVIVDQVFNKLTARQANYILNKAQYWGAGPTHSAVPAHTTSKWDNIVPDKLNDAPNPAFENWIAAIPDMVTVAMPCCFVASRYAGPEGKGYVLQAQFTYNGTTYTRAINVGPETYRTKTWEAQE